MLDAPENSLIDAIYAASTDPGGWPYALQAISDCMDAKGATIVFARDDRSFGAMASIGLTEAALAYQQEGWAMHDVVAQRAVEYGFVGSRDSFVDDDVLAPGERETLPIHRRFYQRFGIGRVGGITLATSSGLPMSLSLHRSVDAAPFSEQEMENLSAIGRHVEIALRLSLEIMDRRSASGLLSHLLDVIKVGAVVLNPEKTVLYANEAARSQAGIELCVGEAIRLGSEAADAELDRHFAEAALSPLATNSPIIITAEGGQPAFLAYLLPFKDTGIPGVAEFASASCVLAITALSRGAGIDPLALRTLFGLTAGEARLASLCGQGVSPVNIADTLSITQGTARIVLQRVFQKVGVTRQAELVARFAALVRLSTLQEAYLK